MILDVGAGYGWVSANVAGSVASCWRWNQIENESDKYVEIIRVSK